ncbi:MAG: hypothetical protein M1484_01635 [Patescibacteria group bacterium]|nr:hypothetical protein [Patescibacteria group bacterium]MCL5431781.1 hypothetical protein [Patescibacteria group bacterium]
MKILNGEVTKDKISKSLARWHGDREMAIRECWETARASGQLYADADQNSHRLVNRLLGGGGWAENKRKALRDKGAALVAGERIATGRA